MSNSLGVLSEADIRQLALLIESLERSTFDFLQLEVGDLKVVIGKGDGPIRFEASAMAASSAQPGAAPAPAAAVVARTPATATPVAAETISPHDGTFEVTAPLLGVFYAQSEPGAPPFVTVGSQVNEDTTVALIEVMKTFNAVPAGMRGTIGEVCAQNAQMVEFGQVLYRIRPA